MRLKCLSCKAYRTGDSLTVKTTYLGAHAVPERYSGDREGYVDEIVRETIPAIAAEGWRISWMSLQKGILLCC